MKRLQLTIFLLFIFQIINAQYLIVGDTTGYEVTEIEETFYPDSQISFDMDCDGIKDFDFHSIKVVNNSPTRCSSYERININHNDSVQIKLNPNNGDVDTLQLGDTLYPTTLIWDSRYYIYLNCWIAWPGVIRSDSAYFVFRKIENNDTSFMQINFSNKAEVFTIHKIISECDKPFTILMRESFDPNATVDSPNTINIPEERILYPNPFHSVILINKENIKQVNIYDNIGRLVYTSFESSRIENLDFLPIGIYFIEIIDFSDKRIIEKILKINDY